MASPNEYTPEQYRQAALKWAEKLGLMDWWPVIDWIATYESGWRGIQSTYPDPEGPGGFEDSWGPFQLHIGGVGGDKTPAELLDPDTNAKMALEHLKERLEYYGGSINPATDAWSVTHGIDMEWVLANPGQTPAPGQAGIPAPAAAITGGAGGVEPDRNDPKYIFTAEQVGPGGKFEGLGVVGGFNYALYAGDVDFWRLATEGGAIGADEIDYINASINLIAQQMSAELIDVQKADLEIGKRISALTEAGKTYRELAPYSLPEGAEWIPGGEPGGLYEQMGIGAIPAQTTRINPLAQALAALGRTPEMGPTPEASFEAALTGAQQLRGGMGAAPTTTALAVPAAPPSHLEAALATAAAPTTPAVEVEPPGGWRTPAAGQPTGFPDFPPPAGGQAGPPLGTLSPEEANRLAAIIFAILGALGGGGGQQMMTPTSTAPGMSIFEQALRGR